MKSFNIAVIVLLIVIIGFQTCNLINIRAEKNDRGTIDTLYIQSNDHFHNIPFKVEVPVPYKVEVPGTPGTTLTIPATIDSLAVVIDYYSKRHYSDTLTNDSIEVIFNYATYKNRPVDREFKYRWKAPTMIIKETKTVERQLAFAGLDVSGGHGFFSLTPSIYIDTRRAMYGVGYDPFNKIAKVGVYGKLKLWKRKIKR